MPGPGLPPPPPRRRHTGRWVAFGVVTATLLGLAVWGVVRESGETGRPVPANGSGSGAVTSGPSKVVTASDGKSRITVPESWNDVPKSFRNELAVLQLGDLRREQYILVITAAKDDFDDLAGFAKVCLSDTENMEGPSIGPERSLTVGGLPAVQHEITGKTEGVRVAFWYTMIEGRNNYFQLVAWTLPSRQSEAEPTITEVINSFRELGAG